MSEPHSRITRQPHFRPGELHQDDTRATVSSTKFTHHRWCWFHRIPRVAITIEQVRNLQGKLIHTHRHTIQYLLLKIFVLDKLDYCANLKNIEQLTIAQTSNSSRAMSDLQTFCFVLREQNIDTALHFAAQTHVDNSFGNSLEFTTNNIEGTHVYSKRAERRTVSKDLRMSLPTKFMAKVLMNLTRATQNMVPSLRQLILILQQKQEQKCSLAMDVRTGLALLRR